MHGLDRSRIDRQGSKVTFVILSDESERNEWMDACCLAVVLEDAWDFCGGGICWLPDVWMKTSRRLGRLSSSSEA